MIVRLLPDAEADLEGIGDFIARDNPRRALSFVQELRTACLGLSELAYAFPLVPHYIEGQPERVDILHVVHGARNYQAILFG